MVVSDLHLGVGQDRVTQTYSWTENFFADGAFERCLSHSSVRLGTSRWLVLNGDIFDFLRVDRSPHSDEDYRVWEERLAWLGETERAKHLERPVSRTERRFGLKTRDYAAIWKLILIFEGHPLFFETLARWVREGSSLIIVKGNHDLELHWPLVRLALRDELVQHGANVEDVEQRIAFSDDSVIVDNLYIAHGHVYEKMTRVDGSPELEREPPEINLPLGSFVNRYFINQIERLDPFIDNTKPVARALFVLLRKRPARILTLYFRARRFVFKALAKRKLTWEVFLLVLAMVLPTLALLAITAYLIPPSREFLLVHFPFLKDVSTRIIAVSSGLAFPFVAPYLHGLFSELRRELFPPRDHLEVGARRALETTFPAGSGMQRVYAVLGHSHVQDVRLLAAAPREELYVNTGTWIPLWPRDRQDLVGRVIYSFAQFTKEQGGQYRHRAYEWDDEAGEPRPARILTPEDRPDPGFVSRGRSPEAERLPQR